VKIDDLFGCIIFIASCDRSNLNHKWKVSESIESRPILSRKICRTIYSKIIIIFRKAWAKFVAMSRTWSGRRNLVSVQVVWCFTNPFFYYNLHNWEENKLYRKENISEVLKHTSTLLVRSCGSCREVVYFLVPAEHLVLKNQDSARVKEKIWLVNCYHKVKYTCIENPPVRIFANFFTYSRRLLGLFWSTGYSRNTGNIPESISKIRICW